MLEMIRAHGEVAMVEDELMDRWRGRMSAQPGPIYLSIVEALDGLVRTGELQEGDRLPTQRRLAAGLDVDLTTVTRAFNEARRRGLLDATVGRGSFVRRGGRRWTDGQRAVVDMTMNLPPPLPGLGAMLSDGLARLLRRQDAGVLMSYRVTSGTAEEREAGATWLRPILGRRPAEQVLMVPGAQCALAAVMTTFLRSGDALLAERFTYPGLRALAAQTGLALAGVAVDAQGMLPEALDLRLRETRARLVYCNPTVQNPTTATMSVERREAIVAVARAHDVLILEDDPYGLLLDGPLPALAGLAPERVFYVATLAKVISPGLRTAFLVVPDMDLAHRLTAAVRAVALTGPGLLSGLAAQWIRDGQAAEMLGAIRSELEARQTLARAMLGDAPCAHPQGPHVWLRLPDRWSSTGFAGYVHRQGLALAPSEVFAVEGEPPPRVRVALGSAPDRDTLRASLEAIGAALNHNRPLGYGAIV